jgi:CRISPR/Cas system-associated exonuclease Cas4 (RecB family)
MFQITWTKIRTFERCRKQYWYQYMSGLPRPAEVETPQLAVGKAVHRAMKTLCDTGMHEDGLHHLETFLRMPAHASAGPGTAWFELARSMYDAGCEAHDSIASVDRLSERDTWVPARDDGVTVFARLDRADQMADGTWVVTEWKTGKHDDPEDIDRQLDLGHLGFRTIKPALRSEGTVHAVSWNLQAGRTRRRELTADDARKTHRYAVRYAQRIQSTVEFDATPSRACSFCAWRDQCPDAEPDLSWLTDKPADGDDLFEPLEPDGDDLLPFD